MDGCRETVTPAARSRTRYVRRQTVTNDSSPDAFLSWFRGLDDLDQERSLCTLRNAAAPILVSIVRRKITRHNGALQRLPRGRPGCCLYSS